MKTYIYLFTISQYLLAISGQYLEVRLEQGTVRGHKHDTRALYAFHGIQYATAPVGRDKYKAPLPPPSRDEVFDANNDFVICPQFGLPYTEECLVVNVFIPENTRIGIDPPKTVLVIIHGGAFVVGFGNLGLPYNLVEKDIIVVTFNYRLGGHGFLCLHTENIPGNAGLKDQIAALKWIKHNIRSFGGNPEDIALLGYSAGAFSAEVLMLSPVADGLFNRVILESGSAMSTWLDLEGPKTAQIAASINEVVDVENITMIEDFYLSLSYDELFRLPIAFLPCLESEEYDDSVVTISPHETLRSGNYSKLPLLTGYTSGEGLLYYEDRVNMMAAMNLNFSSTLPPNMALYVKNILEEVVEILKSFYFGNEVITDNLIQNYTDYFSDGNFIYPVTESARLHALHSASVYLYEFTYESFAQQQTEQSGLGSTHCAQSFLILSDGWLSQTDFLSENDLIVQSRLIDMWSNFIKFGKPAPQGQTDYWEPLDPEKMNYLVIDLETQNRTLPVPERMQIWDRIMKETSGQYLEVTINQGTVRGHKHDTRALYAFVGIPYATPPKGRDKFKAPMSPPSWDGVLDATNGFVICPQLLLPYTEDCLAVNVFIPGDIQIETDLPKSVLVIIHGGGFDTGFGNFGLPYNLVEKDIVVVTLNYRLAGHGFLCLHTENIPGNAGLKDQLAALKWVKHNIRAFGGNPEDITILGYSAGAFTAEVLMLSPAADGLFNRVILESGSAMSTWLDLEGIETAKNIASLNGITDVEDITNLEEFYLSLSYTELFSLSHNSIITAFFPCLESEKYEDSVVTVLPHETLQKGNYSKLPLLTGYTNGEGLIFFDERESFMTGMNQNLSNFFPPNLPLYLKYSNNVDVEEVVEILKSFYFDEETITNNLLQNYTDYFSDGIFIYPIVESAKLHALHSAPVYLYEFTYESFSQQQSEQSGFGSTHCTQTFLILNEGWLSQLGVLSENDIIVQKRLVDMWSNFVKFGEPVSQGETDYWEPLDPEIMNYFVIDLGVENRTFPIPERLQLWDRVMTGNEDPDSASGLSFSLSLFFITLLLIIR